MSAVARDGIGARRSRTATRLQRPRRARRGHLLDASAGDHVEHAARAAPPGLLGLRAGRVPPRRRHVVRGAAGGRRGRAAPRATDPQLTGRSGRLRCSTRTANDASPTAAARVLRAGRDSLTRLGRARRRRARSQALDGDRSPTRTASSRTTTPAPRARLCGRKRRRSRRRSTTGTTRSTSTGSSFARGQQPGRAAPRPARHRHESLPLEARDTTGRRPRGRSAPRAAQSDVARVAEQVRVRAPRDAAGTSSRSRSVGAGGPARTRSASGSSARPRLRSRAARPSDLADLPRRVADDDRPRRDVLDDDGARADERLLADLDRRAEDGAAADARAAADRRALASARAAARCGP